MGMFKKGYSAVEEEKKRQEENKAKAGKRLFRFFLPEDGDEADVRFLTEEPVTFEEHTVQTVRAGKKRYDNILCSKDKNCSLCQQGDRPSFKGAFLIWDTREYETQDDKGKKKKVKGSLKLYVAGTKVLSQVQRVSKKYGLTNRTVTITRLGEGTSTSYTIERGDEEDKLSKAEITNMIPEALRDMYTGTMDSLYSIIEECLSANLEDGGNPSYDSHSDDDDDDDGEGEYNSRKNLISDDEDEDEEPKKKPSNNSKPMFKKKKPVENSVKSAFKTKTRR